jgi:hypothetical protein
MKSHNRILQAIFAFAIIFVLAKCSQDPELDFTNKSSDSIHDDDGTSPGRSFILNNSVYRVILNSTVVNAVPPLCGNISTKNFTRAGINYGQLTVGNDSTDHYFSLSGIGGWSLKEIKLYAGQEANIPITPGNGVPLVGQFPINENMYAPYPATWMIKVAKGELGNAFWVSCRATFIHASGTLQTVWSEGDLFNTISSASKFEYTEQECIVNEGCAYGQGTWYGLANISWPDANGTTTGDITVGGENYSRDEARLVWWANNGSCPGVPDAKKALSFISSIRLSGASVIGNAGLWDDIAIVDGWLESLDRLTESNICSQPDAPLVIQEAIARIGDWIAVHHC